MRGHLCHEPKLTLLIRRCETRVTVLVPELWKCTDRLLWSGWIYERDKKPRKVKARSGDGDICIDERQEQRTKRCHPEFTYRDLKRQTSSKENYSNSKIKHNILMEAAAGDLVVRWTLQPRQRLDPKWMTWFNCLFFLGEALSLALGANRDGIQGDAKFLLSFSSERTSTNNTETD